MAVLRILNYPDPRLKTVAEPVTDINDPIVQQMIADMLETLVNTPHCGGLAATQLDIQNPKRIFVFYDFFEDKNSKETPTVVINPEIVNTEGEVFEQEGCMSVYPNEILAAILRPARTHMRGLDRHGKPIEFIREGYLAKNFMHEVDHLNGKLYIDHLKPLKRTMLDKKIKKVRTDHAKQKEE
ncbi:MAG: peptide deformylase [Gammaproteobacteria bacterium RIFCSPHIGHO2_12_FULL_35_23]|nr:MAG: peptide deformylase [Gammaproteobacteria bacterium RIFCSPHIGHO2_12_FULL_35_23]